MYLCIYKYETIRLIEHNVCTNSKYLHIISYCDLMLVRIVLTALFRKREVKEKPLYTASFNRGRFVTEILVL